MIKNKGTLFLIPSVLSASGNNTFLSEEYLSIINGISNFIVENERTSRRYLLSIGYNKDINNTQFHILNKHTDFSEYQTLLKPAFQGENVGLISESGCPCIADPGSDIVKIAHESNIKVVPMIGPSSILLALMASGFNGQKFSFEGYLPIKNPQRVNKIKELEKKAQSGNQTQIFIETPYRNISLLKDILSTCNNNTLLCIASGITTPDENICTKTISQWKKSTVDFHKKETVFLLYK